MTTAGSKSASSDVSPERSAPPRVSVWKRVTAAIETPQFGLSLMMVTILLLLGWAAVAKVDRVVRVEGRVIPAGRSQTIQHLEGGIVSAIEVKEGDEVKRGDVLVVIDDTSAEALLSESRTKLAAQRIKGARLAAEAGGTDTMAVPSDLQQYKALVDTELQLFRARRQKLDTELQVLDEQIRQKAAGISEIESRRARLGSERVTAHKRYDMLAAMAAKSAASNLEVLDAQSKEQRLDTELAAAEGSLPKLRAEMAELQARVQEAKARYRADAQAELSGVLVETDRLRQLITTEADRYRRTEVRAPVDGIVNRVNVTTVGGVVKPGDTIVELTPSTGNVLIEAEARPADRGELRAGLPVKVRVSAYDAGELGVLRGEVEEVGADTVTDARGEAHYRVNILVDHLPDRYAGRRIIPGMTVTGDVIIGQRTVLKYITSPFTKFSYYAFRDAR